MSNFGFLEAEWPQLHSEAMQTEKNAVADPRASCFYARRTLELALRWLYTADGALQRPYAKNLAAMISEPSMVNLVGPTIRAKMDAIRLHGNAAVHSPAPVAGQTSMQVATELFHVMYWIARSYARSPDDAPAPGLVFDRTLVPQAVSAETQRKKQVELKALAQEHAAKDAEADAELSSEDVDSELAKLRAQIKAAKAANAARPDTHDYNEAETRTLIIDVLLKEAGWHLTEPRDREFAISGLPASVSPSGKGKVDYVLWDDDGKPLALVEAKRTTRDALVGQQQAKLYADALEKQFGQRPVIFCTNGYQTYLWDDHPSFGYPIREVQGFYTKAELRLLIQRRAGRRPLGGLEINDEIAARHYQSRAIRRIAETFEKRQRHALLVMATGAGKTRTAIALSDLLARAGWVKRVLFLADRKALVNQATNAFKEHLPSFTTINLLKDRNPDARVYVSTYPTMMGLINEMDEGGRRFGPGFFDLIIIDEAHRSIYQKYGALFDYFDALLVGLTATPKDEVDRNTYRRFELEDGVPTDVYDLDEAVNEGYLVRGQGVDVPLKFQRGGIKYDDLSEEDKEKWDLLEWDTDDGSVPTEISSEELNKYLFNADTVDKTLEVLMLHGAKVAGGDRLGKTIIFAKNNAHAAFIAERFNANYPEYQGEFARVITHQSEYAQDLIDKFSDKDTNPHIAISVDMLDTGIDVPEIVNLVFFKLVRSKTKFWQMYGRGTRLCPDLFGPNLDKSGFLVFDMCQNVEFFNQDLGRAEGKLLASLSERLFRSRADLLMALDQLNPGLVADTSPEQATQAPAQDAEDGTSSEVGLRWDLARRLHQEVTGMNIDNFLVRPYRRQVDRFADFSAWKESVGQDEHTEVTENLAKLPTAFREDENSEEAKRFDLLALRLQLALLRADPEYARQKAQVQDIASALLDQSTIPAVRDQQVLIEELSGDEWWQDVTLPMLEVMRRRIRGLVKLIEKTKRGIVYSDFEDEVGELALTEVKSIQHGTNKTRFEAKVRNYLRSHEDHLAVQKIRRNRQITTTDLTELEQIFLQTGFGTEEDIQRVKNETGGMGIFLRSLGGLERSAAAAAFDAFQAERSLTASQLDFLNLLIDYLAKNGVVDAGAIFEQPFTTMAPHGPVDVFPDQQDVHAIMGVLRAVHGTAVPVEGAA
ncbi:DEAD/DEAH box helicase family protein [Streptomyces boninensis]|uniref:DEAD/DEAH box helicase family protein n=1 Tax=Streptomyces boninensis TaxID=2039455 RepID=UPI003B21F91C